ncbi:ribonuclease domain-containing protein [Pilibacter termitis]|uniref:ribonuclease domain-containing protein n=1 Tax=Pilibacter termitis TaxID=263852 RepID=UPI0009994E47
MERKCSRTNSRNQSRKKWGNNDEVLPKLDSKGRIITYKEFDVNNYSSQLGSRDKERLVRGSDGSVYYTKDHYNSFVKIK